MNKTLFAGSIACTLWMASCQSPQTAEVPLTDCPHFNARGWVTGVDGKPLEGAKITAPDTVVYTDSCGFYSLTSKSATDRYLLKIEKDGYFYHICSRFLADTATYIVSMVPKKSTSFSSITTFDSDRGTDLEVDGATISIPANALMLPDSSAYNGKVNLSVVYLNPDNPRFDELIPGGDLCATMVNGDTAALVSYGMVRVEMESENGEKLQLKTGSKANLKFPVSSFQKSNPHNTIPLWWFDENVGLWREEGLTLNKGDYYEGYVSHFTWWNCDHYFKNGARVRLYFLDEKGEPLDCGYRIEFGKDEGILGFSKSISVPANRELKVRVNTGVDLYSDVCAVIPPLKKDERRVVYVRTSLRKVNVKLVDEKGVQLMYEPIFLDDKTSYWKVDANCGYLIYLQKGKSVSIKVPRFSISKELSSDMVDNSGVYEIVCKKTGTETHKTANIKSGSKNESQPAVILNDVKPFIDEAEDNTVYEKVDVMASYPGGLNALRMTLSSRVVYPKEAMLRGEDGTVIVEFVVEKDGTLTNFNIFRHASASLDSEALRVVQTLKFMPAIKGEKVVRSKYRLPVSFKLSR